MKIFNPYNFETEVLNDIIDILNSKVLTNRGYEKICDMTDLEKYFLNGIIRQNKPKKILELGVSAGGSSAIILNAIKDIDNAKLYSIDYSDKWYLDNDKNSGFIIDEKFQHLSNKWQLYTGGVAAKFMEEIGAGIDICFLDTMHRNPGEFLDLLMVLPYINKGGVIILHDIIFHVYNMDSNDYTNGIIFSSLNGKKYILPEDKERPDLNNLGNIGAVILDDNIMDRIYDYFHLLTFPWAYMPTDEDIQIINKHFYKHYDKNLIELFDSIVKKNKSIFSAMANNQKLESYFDTTIYERFDRLLNSIAWWIPVRKLRDNFRNKILYGSKSYTHDNFIGGGVNNSLKFTYIIFEYA